MGIPGLVNMREEDAVMGKYYSYPINPKSILETEGDEQL